MNYEQGISSDKYYSDSELIIHGIGQAAQEQGRRSGKLKFAPLAMGFCYFGAHIHEWLAALTQPAEKAPEGRRPAKTSANATASATDIFTKLVAARTEAGMTRPQAIKEIAAQHQDLYRAYLGEANTRRLAHV